MLTPAQLRAVYETALTRPGPTYFWKKGDPTSGGGAFTAAELAEKDRELLVQQALATVQRVILEDAALEHLRTESARLDAIRFHVGPKFWTSAYDRNALVDDIRALAAGEPATAVAGTHYYDIEFEADRDDEPDLSATESMGRLADVLDTLFSAGADTVEITDGQTLTHNAGRPMVDVGASDPEWVFEAADVEAWRTARADGHPRFSSDDKTTFNSFNYRARTWISSTTAVFHKILLDEPRGALIIGLSPINEETPDEV